MKDKVLLDAEEYAKLNKVPIILPDSAKVLVETVKAVQPRAILEIGTAIGYSGMLMLRSAPRAKLFTVEIDESLARVARLNFERAKLAERVTQWTGDAERILTYMTGKYDLIFLDGPKGHYQRFLPYLKDSLESSGVIIADNIHFKGKTEHTESIAHKHRTIVRSLVAFCDELKADSGFEVTEFDAGDGLLIAKALN